MDISVIIPAFNEEKTIASIVEIVRFWGKAKEIIVVNDGSTDDTENALKEIPANSYIYIKHRKNKGKADALVTGIKKAKGKYLMFLDGDLTGLSLQSLDLLIKPMLETKADMVMGIARFWKAGTFSPFDELTGQRMLRKDDILPYLKEIPGKGYGIEIFLNNLYATKRIIRLHLPHLYILGKMDKQSPQDATLAYAKEAYDLIKESVSQETYKLAPQIKKTLKMILSYLQA